MDLAQMVTPKSDQQNYDDYLAGPRTVTISGVREGSNEQPLNIELEEYPGRPFKPNLSMRRVLLKAWGKDPKTFVGRRMTLFGNPAVIWAGKPVGGVEISHLSHIDKPLAIPLTVTKGKRKNFIVQPLKEATPSPPASPTTPTDYRAEADKYRGQIPALQAMYGAAEKDGADPETLAYIKAAAVQEEQ